MMTDDHSSTHSSDLSRISLQEEISSENHHDDQGYVVF